MPSELEDDVLMAYLSLFREMETLKERNALIEEVWKALDLMVRSMLKDPILSKALEPQLKNLRNVVEAVLTYDAEHQT